MRCTGRIAAAEGGWRSHRARAACIGRASRCRSAWLRALRPATGRRIHRECSALRQAPKAASEQTSAVHNANEQISSRVAQFVLGAHLEMVCRAGEHGERRVEATVDRQHRGVRHAAVPAALGGGRGWVRGEPRGQQ
eukprot:7243793-Prymnesium_polylepis.1